jgi:hypothetical protein
MAPIAIAAFGAGAIASRVAGGNLTRRLPQIRT